MCFKASGDIYEKKTDLGFKFLASLISSIKLTSPLPPEINLILLLAHDKTLLFQTILSQFWADVAQTIQEATRVSNWNLKVSIKFDAWIQQ